MPSTEHFSTQPHPDLAALKEQFQELEQLHAAGHLSDQAFQDARLNLERRILDLVLFASGPEVALHGDEVPVAQSHDGAAELDLPEQQADIPDAPRSAVSWREMSVLAVLGVALTVAGYTIFTSSKLGSKGTTMAVSAPVPIAPQPAAQSSDSDQVSGMLGGLAARLKDNPKDGAGWVMLARSYLVLGRTPQALDAYQKALSVLGDDASLLADYADALAVQNGGSLAGEPMKLVERALKKDAANVKALYLSGTHAFMTKNYAEAVRFWEKAMPMIAVSQPQYQQMKSGLDEARRLAGLPAQDATQIKPATAVASSDSISGTVTLSSRLSAQVKPEDTVFIFATPADGGRMPLAILRRQVKDLPIKFTLDDRLAMSPDTRLSKAKRVNLSARVSKTGHALPEKGDFLGQVQAVEVGKQDVSIEIRDVVNP